MQNLFVYHLGRVSSGIPGVRVNMRSYYTGIFFFPVVSGVAYWLFWYALASSITYHFNHILCCIPTVQVYMRSHNFLVYCLVVCGVTYWLFEYPLAWSLYLSFKSNLETHTMLSNNPLALSFQSYLVSHTGCSVMRLLLVKGTISSGIKTSPQAISPIHPTPHSSSNILLPPRQQPLYRAPWLNDASSSPTSSTVFLSQVRLCYSVSSLKF